MNSGAITHAGRRVALLMPCIVALLAPALRAAQDEQCVLPPTGSRQTAPAEFCHEAASAGALALIVRGEGDNLDLVIEATDEFGQLFPDGRIDDDFRGNLDDEQGVIVIPSAGRYTVRVQAYGSEGTFDFFHSWMPVESLGFSPMPGDVPSSGAPVLEVGQMAEDTIGPDEADPWDWWQIPSTGQTERVTVSIQGDGDLALDVYEAGLVSDDWPSSDRDLEGDSGRESIQALTGTSGPVYVRVRPVFSFGEINYTISAEADN